MHSPLIGILQSSRVLLQDAVGNVSQWTDCILSSKKSRKKNAFRAGQRVQARAFRKVAAGSELLTRKVGV